ncbi:aldehyde dehydrogenase family protein [Acrocarpospora macrocephala]|uniref:Aldehyde dehydrogenase n=2 Tax=Acrocarpospora macrocephala TaxID=150177 RepID=A0A5M3WLV2_9ACTN|nr:aldehyde dehydrogenase [Acrocarpospora macrocephala]
MTIGGAAAPAKGTFDVYAPATGEVLARPPECTPDQVEDVMTAMTDAFPGWARADRGPTLLAAADALEARAEEVADVVAQELGAQRAQAAFQVTGLAGFFRYYADLELPREVLKDDGQALVEVVRRPVGPVVAIPPWNGPLYMAGMKVAPALAAGNPVVLKPSPFTPLSSLLVGEILREVFPPGVLNVVSGGASLGGLLTAHPVPRKISFTGSVATGQKVAMAAAADLKRVTLELGGNDAAVLLDDIDVAEVAASLFRAGFHNCGQVCVAPKRVFAPASRYDDLVDALSALARAAKVGGPGEEGVTVGPVQNAAQLAHVEALAADAAAKGAVLSAGGGRVDRPGYFFAPAIVSGAVEGMRVVDEEQFGPLMPVIRYDDLEDAIRRANATPYGLGASAWSADVDRAVAVADRLEAGQVWVNTHFATLGPPQPVVGTKHSGLGVEKGHWGLASFTDVRVRYVTR